jgi:hypothetical protein
MVKKLMVGADSGGIADSRLAEMMAAGGWPAMG